MGVNVLLEAAVCHCLSKLQHRRGGINLIVNRLCYIFVSGIIFEVKFIGNFGSDTL